MISLLLATAFPLANPITLEVEVGRAEKAVAALSQASGIKMSASEPMASEVVFLKVDQRPLSEVMTSLARVTGGAWEKKADESYVLFRSPVFVEAEKQKVIGARLKALNTYRSKVLKGLEFAYDPVTIRKVITEREGLLKKSETEKNQKRLDEYYDRIKELDLADPTYRAIARCIRDLDMKQVAMLGDEDCLVFGLDPNAVQLPLPASAGEAMARISAEQREWGKILGSVRELVESQDDDWDDFGGPVSAWSRTLPLKRNPQVMALVVSRSEMNGWEFNVQMYTESGANVINIEDTTFNQMWDYDPESERGITLDKPRVTPSKESKALTTRLANRGQDVDDSLATLARFFDDPVNFDPLWIENQEQLTAIAESKKKSVIACLPDDAFTLAGRIPGEAYYFDSGVRESAFPWCVATESDSTLELKPASFLRHWTYRANRPAMAAYVKEFRSKGKVDLFTYLRLVPATSGFGAVFVSRVDPRVGAKPFDFDVPPNLAVQRFFASLTAAQVEQLRRRGAMAYRELSISQLALAGQVLYATRASYSKESEGELLFGGEPTFELPNGVKEGKGLTARIQNARVLQLYNERGEVYGTEEIDAEPSGFAVSGGVKMASPPAGGVARAKFTLHTREQMDVRFMLTQSTYKWTFVGPFSEAKEKPEPISKLPKDIRAKLAHLFEGPGDGNR